MQSRGKRWLLSLLGVLWLSAFAQAQDVSNEALRKENEMLRMERDALQRETVQLKKKLAQLQKETRTELEQARIEIDVLKAKLDRLTDRLEQCQKAQKAPITPVHATSEPRATAVTKPPERVSRKPGEPLKGTITEISDASSLVAVSLGSEDGIQTGQELECYRLGSADKPGKNPPLYVGKLRIMRVTPRESVAQYLPSRGIQRRPMVGDEVASELLP